MSFLLPVILLRVDCIHTIGHVAVSRYNSTYNGKAFHFIFCFNMDTHGLLLWDLEEKYVYFSCCCYKMASSCYGSFLVMYLLTAAVIHLCDDRTSICGTTGNRKLMYIDHTQSLY
uniref:Secreted protein n=1 Tax=Amphimedon queenslandica TaxID=400682 RepID=A0A1X7V5C3_AMPQE